MPIRILLFTISLLSYLAGWCGEPLLLDVTAIRKGQHEYSIIIKATLEKGWHVYAANDEATGVEGIQVSTVNTYVSIAPSRSLISGVITEQADPLFDGKTLQVIGSDFTLRQTILINGAIPASLPITIKGFAANGEAFIPIEKNITMALEGGVEAATNERRSNINLQQPVADCGEGPNTHKGLGAIFLLGFAGGLIALLTPCVFPMIPVTVSFFTSRAADRRQGIRSGLVYGLFILLIYLVASTPFHLMGNINPQIFNTIATNTWVNLFFFIVFVLFALSFFGLFEIRLPAGIANVSGSKSGIFFMALTLVVVSFSCTGPILGSLLVGSLSTDGGAWQLTAGMGGFGLALGLPFGLFAMFPQWLKAIPRSGGWMETVKKTLAFAELALAIKFLSNADLVQHWGILKREVFIGLWLLIALGLAAYLFGLFNRGKMSSLHNADKPVHTRLSKGRMIAGTTVMLFAIYLTPGITKTRYANLQLLSGFPPPLSYSIYGKKNIHGKGLEPDVINDYEQALALSQQTGKPMLIDFTGWACVNCRKMEEQVWTEPSVRQLIKNNYVLVSLYVDDRKKLPEGGTVGQKWAAFQSKNFGQVTQPLYVQLSPEEKLLNHPVGYTPDVKAYEAWLQCGIKAGEQQKQLTKK